MAKNDQASDILTASKLLIWQFSAMEIGDRIKAERNRVGLTQMELAARVGVDKSAVAQWESPQSRKGITSPNLVKVAAALGVGVGRLTGDETDDRPIETESDDERTLLSLYRLLPGDQQGTYLALFYVANGMTPPSKLEDDPPQGKRITGRRPSK